MAANVGPDVDSVLRFGVLPENLPAPISTNEIASHYQNAQGSYIVTARARGSLSHYSASKRGGQRRLFGLPHPTYVHDQGAFLVRHWETISSILGEALGSLSTPNFMPGGPRSVRITPHSELPRARLKAFSRFRYCAITDVARCYPSIYTHAIPWAINGREQAKADTRNYSSTVFGNRLDFILRQAQDAQTVGIPVGPDTSRVVAELLLSAVDKHFLSRYSSSKPVYLRHVDDYWIGGNTVDDCERHLQNLRAALREFELDLNDLKTRVVEANRTLGETWPSDFERWLKRSFGIGLFARDYDPIATLANIIDRANRENDDGMIRHAIRKLDENRLWDRGWEVLEHFLAHCAMHFPHSFDYVARVIIWRIRTEKPYNKELWKEVTTTFAHQASALGKDAEALWALWLARELKMKIPRSLSDSLISHTKPLVLGFLAHMFAHGRTRDRELGTKLATAVIGNPYCGTAWPLALELNHLDVAGVDFASYQNTEACLKLLHEQKTSLINWDAVPAVFAREGEDDAGDDEPHFAIEDFTSDYDHDSSDDDAEDNGF